VGGPYIRTHINIDTRLVNVSIYIRTVFVNLSFGHLNRRTGAASAFPLQKNVSVHKRPIPSLSLTLTPIGLALFGRAANGAFHPLNMRLKIP
jgi:hypothetical protein